MGLANDLSYHDDAVVMACEFIVTDASTAGVTVILIDVCKGVLTQAKLIWMHEYALLPVASRPDPHYGTGTYQCAETQGQRQLCSPQ